MAVVVGGAIPGFRVRCLGRRGSRRDRTVVVPLVVVEEHVRRGPPGLEERSQKQGPGETAATRRGHHRPRGYSLRPGSHALLESGTGGGLGERTVYGLLLALLSALLFGASTPASKVLLASFSPFQLAGLLYLGAAIGMAPLVAVEHRRGTRMALDRANAARLGGAVLFGGLLGPVLLLFALRLTLAGSVSLLLNLEMVATAVLGVALFREHLARAGWLGVAGVVVAGGILSGGAGWPGLLAALLVAAACASWGLDNHLTALIDGITPARSTLVKGAVAGATNLAIGVASDPLTASVAPIGAALLVGAVSYGASIALYILSAHELGATRAQALFASAPFVGAALSFAFLGEPLGLAHAAASLLLVASIAALFWSQHAHPHVHAELEHMHSHRHDDGHHFHDHPDLPREARHSHAHRHEHLVHAHPHWPDVHHRHGHPSH